MRISLHIEYEDGTSRDVVCNAADLVAFEDKYNVSVVNLGAEPRIGWLLYLAWHAERRVKNTKDDFDKWCETVAGVGEAETDPKSEA